ncbi:uncharacterized protein LOC133883194 isoform X3 [Phragmites australis]|uniref:uncharacterized protein LOC133883194 isoform X3 n=1 Tax=Phragmites australis TaxID=29695 RepID=UPI002D79D489|nr:uncharacterized protein LOC133883194 isoform X3 [Phragmites australis]
MAKGMVDMEKQAFDDGMDAHEPVEGGVVAAKMNSDDLKKWLPYWLFVAVSVIALTNRLLPDGRDDADPKGQLISPELAMFAVLLCAICLVLRTVKQTM